MSEAMKLSRPEITQEEFCLDDIFESLKQDREQLERENLERENLSREASIAASSASHGACTETESPSADTASNIENSAGDPNADPAQQDAATALRNEPRSDRRRRRRALISAPVRVRGINVTDGGVDEVTTTIDVSRAGILFDSGNPGYSRGMEVAVIFPFSTAPTALHAEQQGRIVRVIGTSDGRYAVAVALGEGVGEDIVDSCGRKLAGAPERVTTVAAVEPQVKRPLVLVVDSDETVRCSLKSYLTGEGYDVMAANNAPDAREVLNMFTPALVIAEVEGDGLPGYDLCAHVKSIPRLKHIPVVLTTSSGYPSDYANAHSLGAVVCMTKPYKQERLGHVARLLAPPSPEFCSQKTIAAPRPADPSRRCGYGAATSAQTKSAQNGSRRFRFPSFR
jgi:CheY-like chemotaxis protein